MELKDQLIKLITCGNEIKTCIDKIHPHISESFKECCNSLLVSVENTKIDEETLRIKLDYILTYIHDHLNIGKWTDVPEFKRHAFTAVCFVKAIHAIQLGSLENLQASLACIDKGFLLGLPLLQNANLLTESARLITESIHEKTGTSTEINHKHAKRKLENFGDYDKLQAREVCKMSKPSIECFYKDYFQTQSPSILQDCMSHWPAVTKWLDINYLINKAGDRTVPIEIGSSYSDENFSQKLMTVKEFIKKYYLSDSKEVGYLAQHDLLTQIPDLKNDICIPEYCCTSRDIDNKSEESNENEPEICAWFGPSDTVSSLHYDPKDNLLCQVFGTKQVILFAPSDSEYLYPHGEFLLTNTAQVDPVSPDLLKYPNFTHATMYKCILEAGEMLYIPPKWWHHVTALDKSFSINFWWK